MPLVQQNGGVINGNTNIVTSLGLPTTAGNSILIFAQGAGVISTPAGFTSRSQQLNNQALHLFEKLVASGDATDTPTPTMAGAYNATWQIAEWSGLTAFGISGGNNSGFVANGSKPTPSITPAAGDDWALFAFMGVITNNIADTFAAGDPQTWTNSFTGQRSDQIAGSSGGGRDSLCGGWASRTVTGDGVTAFSTAASFAATGGVGAPATIIASYKVAAGGGSSLLVPVAVHHRKQQRIA